MSIPITYKPSVTVLEMVATNYLDVLLRVNCRDMGGHSYSYGDCSRCGHAVEVNEESGI